MPGSSFADVLLVNPLQLHPATPDEVAQAEFELGVRMPSGYAAYVQRLGQGALGDFIRVYPPAELPGRTLDWRERIEKFWFWDTTDAGVAPESLQEHGVVVAESFDGDELCFDPTEPETLLVLPRDDEIAHRVGPGFLAAVEWMLSGVLKPSVEAWTFEAWSNRIEVRGTLPSGPRLADVARAVVELGEHVHPQDLVAFGDRYLFPANDRYPEQAVTLSATPGPALAMRWGEVAIVDPRKPGTAPEYSAGGVHEGEQATVLTTIART